ncbi:hypothetical protein VOLCADRAFT_98196 [Volvox carteri f. nagariensis]|uniref:DNA 3'-5' helicase n=1 Tax=Volvox carteri f. nagariensis TaxID=3068 RepID=D8UEP9_VOLCA|nr:uncharacterized protein VOLCADRAFT_98196 [Volvox carteri f. nagariensis]EFJ41773.1 hypothetical protein VOLCADRAFT_98196 [Volvox carteri f. nagariensis]|eukprot:XP_002957119.1 hypothetical protein VOLCADRAFT_98196 [Volvox carteri f. nagariensis]
MTMQRRQRLAECWAKICVSGDEQKQKRLQEFPGPADTPAASPPRTHFHRTNHTSPIQTSPDAIPCARTFSSAFSPESPSRRAARPLVARALRRAHAGTAAAAAANASPPLPAVQRQGSPGGRSAALEGGSADGAAAAAAAGGSIFDVAFDKENRRFATGDATGTGKEVGEVAAAAAPIPAMPSYGTPARPPRVPRRDGAGGGGGGGAVTPERGLPPGGCTAGPAWAAMDGGGGGDEDELDEVPPTPLSQIRRSGPGGGGGAAGGGRCSGGRRLASGGGGGGLFSPPRSGGGGGGCDGGSAVKETPPESIRRRSRLFESPGGGGGGARVPLSPVPCRLDASGVGGGSGLFSGCGGGGGLFGNVATNGGGDGGAACPPRCGVAPSPGRALARQLMQRRPAGVTAAAAAAAPLPPAVVARNPFSRVARMKTAAQREGEAAAAAMAAVAAMQAEQAAAEAPTGAAGPPAPPAGPKRRTRSHAAKGFPVAAVAAVATTADGAAAAAAAAEAAAASSTPMRLLRRAQEERQQRQEPAAGPDGGGGGAPPGSPFSPILPVRRRPLLTAGVENGGEGDADFNAFFAARAAEAAAAAAAVVPSAAIAAWRRDDGDADDVAIRRLAEGYDALAADADAALALGGGGGVAAAGPGTAAAAGRGGRQASLYGDAQAEMRRLIVEQASEAVDMDKLALLGPRGAAAAGFRSPGAAAAAATTDAVGGAGGVCRDGRFRHEPPAHPAAALTAAAGPAAGAAADGDVSGVAGCDDDDEDVDVAEALLPIAVRDEIRRRRRELRCQRQAAEAPSQPLLAEVPLQPPLAEAPSQLATAASAEAMAAEAAAPLPPAAATVALRSVDRRQALRRQLLGPTPMLPSAAEVAEAERAAAVGGVRAGASIRNLGADVDGSAEAAAAAPAAAAANDGVDGTDHHGATRAGRCSGADEAVAGGGAVVAPSRHTTATASGADGAYTAAAPVAAAAAVTASQKSGAGGDGQARRSGGGGAGGVDAVPPRKPAAGRGRGRSGPGGRGSGGAANGAAAARRRSTPRRKVALALDPSEEDEAEDPEVAVQVPSRRRRKATPSGINTDGGGGGGAEELVKPPRRTTRRNTGPLQASQTRRRRVINGKVVITGGRVPHAAGQGADFLEGFGQGSRCFKCGVRGKRGGGGELDQLVPGIPSPDQIVTDPRVVSDDQLAAMLRAVWGHSGFRGRQLELVRAVLEGTSMLAVLPTGAGKSLTYQLPAILLPGVTLVVSPLLALMDDQLANLPRVLQGRGASLSGGQTREQVDAALSAATRGSVKLLYVAPEKLLTPWLLAALRRLRISLIAVDEAHCVSEWGHSFRPAYLRLGHVLRRVLQPRCVLGLTATATTPTAGEVAAVLGLAPEAVMREPPLRQNLRLKVLHMQPGASESGASRTALLQLLRSQELAAVQSVLVYVAMQWQADEVAGWLQSTHGISASSYHAGRPLPDRNAVATSFRTGRTRVVVATVAFGMGVDHPSIGAVVHLQMPRSLEDYVQQAGRAGRDGREARCYLFLDDQDYQRYRSLVYSGCTELSAVEAFLTRVFAPQPLLPPSPPELPYKHHNDPDHHHNGGGSTSSFGVLQLSTTASELDIGEEALRQLSQLAALGQVHFEPVQKLKALSWQLIRRPAPPPGAAAGKSDGGWAAAGVSALAAQIHARLEAQTAAAAARLDMVWGLMAGAFLQGLFQFGFFLAHDVVQSSNLVLEVEAFLTGAKARAAAMSMSLTPVAVARILHGLAGPAFPTDSWRKAHEWGRFKAVDFPYVRAVAAMVLARRAAAAAAAAGVPGGGVPSGSGRTRTMPGLLTAAAAAAAGGGNLASRKRRLEGGEADEDEGDGELEEDGV